MVKDTEAKFFQKLHPQHGNTQERGISQAEPIPKGHPKPWKQNRRYEAPKISGFEKPTRLKLGDQWGSEIQLYWSSNKVAV